MIYLISRSKMYVPFWMFLFLSSTLSIQAQTLQQVIDMWKADADLKHASWTFTCIDAKNGQVVASYDPHRSLPPASGMKAITTAAALELLGADYRWKTLIQADGIIEKGILKGNLLVKGGGDPTLGSQRIAGSLQASDLLATWADSLYKMGIRRIEGRVLTDETWFDQEAIPGSWNWDDIGQYYGAGCHSLNFMENTYILYYSSNKYTALLDSVYPSNFSLDIDSEVGVRGSTDQAYIYGSPYQNYRLVTGTIPANQKAYEVSGSMPNPGRYLADMLQEALKNRGIEVAHTQIEPNSSPSELLVHYSPVLDSVIRHTNVKSINLYAEALVKTIGKEKALEGSFAAGCGEIERWLSQAGWKDEGYHQEDGSGLSRLNYVSSYNMAQILYRMSGLSSFEVYRRSFPVVGVSGTVKTMARGTAASGKVLAKSGSMQKIRSYSGYVHGTGGGLYTFSIVVNQYGCSNAELKKKIEQIMIAMASLP